MVLTIALMVTFVKVWALRTLWTVLVSVELYDNHVSIVIFLEVE